MVKMSPDRRGGKRSPHRRDPPVKWGGILSHHPSAARTSRAGGRAGRGAGTARGGGGSAGRRHLYGPPSPSPRRSPASGPRRSRGPPPSQRRGGRGVVRRGEGRGPPPSQRREGGDVARRGEGGEKKSELRPLSASEGSIYAPLFRELGGLIRWYADARGGDGDDAVKTVKSMYTQCGCSTEGTKELIMRELSRESGPVKTEEADDANWIVLSMVMEDGAGIDGLEQCHDEVGLVLPTVNRAGDGPAHSHETWTNVVVPESAVGKSYYFAVHNRSPLDLSCEISIDGHKEKAAKNVPIPAGTTRTIKPETRYFDHKWVFSRPERIKLQHFLGSARAQRPHATEHTGKKMVLKQRYNGLRPKDYSQRKSVDLFPEPSSPPYYWKFTGSKEESKVEFYEKQMNLGTVKMDFYYTTGTVKTILDHSGINDLFRLCAVDPVKFKEILLNPRAHTNIGYRTKEQRMVLERETDDSPVENADASMAVVDASSDTAAGGGPGSNDDAPQVPTYWAKNDKYDFERQGHANRKEAMGQLRPTDEFRGWEKVQKMEFACIHAKFFVSLRERRYGRQTVQKRDASNTSSLPTMAHVVDVKASERAVLATEFRSEGVRSSVSASKFRMKRVSGINDLPGWGTGPVFERKLYYRIHDTENGSDSEENDMDEGEDNPDARDHEEVLRENTPLDSYKKEKLGQLDKWHSELTLGNPTTATEMQQTLTSCKDGIRAAQTTAIVDDQVKLYWDQHQKHQWRE